jgi:hypothetical protein
MRQIKIYFEGFWAGFDISNNFITNLLRKDGGYEIVIDPNPDYLFFSVYNYNHLHYKDCIKILYSAENFEPDFNLCDYAIAFQHLHAGDRYLRYPLYVESGYKQLKNKSIDVEKALSRKFCNFIYGNNLANSVREDFFKKLSKYKTVDSGGAYLNNIGRRIARDTELSFENKLSFIKDYKFTIAFENSSLSGYTTEKMVNPMVVNSLPIYWGNPDIHLDFNKESFIYANDFNSLDEVVEEVIRLDKDDDAYIEKLSKPWYSGDDYSEWQSKLLSFLKNIFDQNKDNARRTTDYGYARYYKRRQETMDWLSTRKIFRLSLFNREFSLVVGTKNKNKK